MSERYKQVKNLATVEALRAHLDAVGAELPVDDEVDTAGPLAEPLTIHDPFAGDLQVPNRFAILPMEGWDGGEDGAPSDLVRRRWGRFGASGAGLVWCEATAVRADGRANPNQLVLNPSTAPGFAELRGLLAPDQICGVQLTHSGRYSRPNGSPAPMIAYRHPVLDERLAAADEHLITDDDLDDLVERYIAAAVLARDAGFHFVDIKHCHGYLLHELLAARTREGRYGGDLAGRTAFVRAVIAGIRERAPELAVAVRLSIFDLVPFTEGPDGKGTPVPGPLPQPFGGSESGLEIDLSEPSAMLAALSELGVRLVCTTAGSPYYNPHIQRPAYFPPSDGYKPPNDPLVDVARQIHATAELARLHPEMTFIGSGYSYLQEWLAHVAQPIVRAGDVGMVGLGRMALSYPDLPADVLAGRPLTRGLLCRTFSDCTTAPRAGLLSGCFPLDPFYKDHPQRRQLAEVKAAIRRS